MKISPTINIGGITVTPPGWMWLVVYAQAGYSWAVDALCTDECKKQIDEYFHKQDLSNAKVRLAKARIELILSIAAVQRLEKSDG